MEYLRKPEDLGILDAPRERARHDEHSGPRGPQAPALAPELAERAPTVEEVLASNAFGHCVDDDLGGSPEQRERREAELEETQQEGVAADFEVDGAGPTSEQVPHPDEEEDADADDGADDYFFPAAADAMPIDEPPPKGGEYGGDGADDAGADDAGAAGGAGPAGGGDGGAGDGAGDDDAPPSADPPPPPPVTKKSPSRKRK